MFGTKRHGSNRNSYSTVMKSESKSDQAAIRLFDGRFCQNPWNTTTSFKRTSSAWQGSNMRVMARMSILVASQQLCAAEWGFEISNKFVGSAAIRGTGLCNHPCDGQVTVSTPPVRNQSDLGTTCWNARKQSIAASAGNWVNKGGVTVNVHGLGVYSAIALGWAWLRSA